MNRICIYDTTLRDGSQAEGVSFTVADKVKIARKLDEVGVHYIEGGWPGSNPKDKEFFALMLKEPLHNARLAAFSSTRRKGLLAAEDPNYKELIAARTPVVCIFGKSWDMHVIDVLRTTLDDNLAIIADSVAFLKGKKREVVYDAEHFFDGYKHNPEYALKTLQAAETAGADMLVLCDTNGGTLPQEIFEIVQAVRARLKAPLGIHTHNDLDLAVANSLAAVKAGCVQVQGTFNGFGERCGNADLSTIIGILSAKLNYKTLPDSKLKMLKDTAFFISEVANLPVADFHPFIGHSAFAHKAGVHIDAILKNQRAYEHIAPELFGNHRRFITSELAGKMPFVMKAEQMDLKIDKGSDTAKAMLKALQDKELAGYQFEGADASFELFMKKQLKKYSPFFTLEGFRVHTEKKTTGDAWAEATVHIEVKGHRQFSAADSVGPVEALDKALRNALTRFYPTLSSMHLTDYKVRVLDTKDATAAKVRVLIESQDEHDAWTTVGVHENIIEASWEALVDSIEYKLLKDLKSPRRMKK
ncbi:MAG: citramalate synthase [Candidatus Omnitrophica bacterium]|nr:citramalate synthase [Candidatus Omnitrophota bacterium]